MKCATCPRQGAATCRGEANPRLCRLAAERPAYRKALASESPAGPWPEPPPPPPANPAPPSPTGRPAVDPFTFITRERLAQDTRELGRLVPESVDMVVGIARSGLGPAADLAYDRHLPLWTASRHGGVANPGHGVRMEGRAFVEPRHVLLVDDTAASGREMGACTAICRTRFPEAAITRAVVYCHPQAVAAVDLFAATLDGPHYLAWNWCNAGHGAACAYDFDGILVRDDDTAQAPLFLPRRTVVPLIVTGRHESARGITQAWLDRWGVRCRELVMRDWGAPLEFDVPAIAAFKARHYAGSQCELFAESDPAQALAIAEQTGRPVLCPALGRVIPGRPAPTPFRSHTDAAADRAGADRRWYADLPHRVRDAARDCKKRIREANRKCCGGDAEVCRGGKLDGQIVDVLACARCMADG